MISKNLLITGANGFIGRRLLVTLGQNASNNIRVLSRNPIPGYETECCDFLEDKIPSSVFNSIDVVFHLAGFAHDFKSNDKLHKACQAINVDATIKLAKLAIKNKVKKFIFVSSVKAGGRPLKNRCLDENYQSEPDGLYGRTKKEAEVKLMDLCKNTSMRVVIIRPSLVYGNGMKGNLKLMFLGVQKGWFPPLPKINNKRSMVHVDDLVQSLILVSMDKKANDETFIVTDGQPHSSREIYETMCKLIDKKIPFWSLPKWVFRFSIFLNKSLRYRIEKLIGDEWYSSKKIEEIGFKPIKTIKNLNENEKIL